MMAFINRNRFATLYATIACLVLFGCQNDNPNYCPDISPNPSSELNIFSDLQDKFELASGSRHAGILCHNCYSNNNDDLNFTLDKLYFAMDEGVDFLELDVIVDAQNFDLVKVSHEPASNGVLLNDVLADYRLKENQSPIFIEIKTSIDNHSIIEKLLNDILSVKSTEGVPAYANADRMLVLRSVHFDTTIKTLRSVLSKANYSELKSYIKLSRIQNLNAVNTVKDGVIESYQCGLHMVELDSRLTINEIKQVSKLARSLELGVNVHTLNSTNYEDYTKELKNSVDVLTVEACLDDKYSCSQSDIFRHVKELLE